ncbi:o-succinylbenzoate synthase, partial [uncultured Muriicola sp.]|uniref:o-succinylbenzoate synthase n=1 Tax=uncultured Muriicola sp. TaxID=1583102 RepID=UPI0026253B02
LILEDDEQTGIGECAMFRGLSMDDVAEYETQLQWVCDHIDRGIEFLLSTLVMFPSIQFGLEQAFRSLASQGPFILFPSEFTKRGKPISINGLIWMGNKAFMEEQIHQRIKDGFTCIKLKIGALDFDTELALLKSIRERFTSDEIELRVDANGAFGKEDVFLKLEELSRLDLHSIEQPIKPGNLALMKEVCASGFLDIALDEELIGVIDETNRRELLQIVAPQFIILKPSLIGGYGGSMEWITLANEMGIKWWITSALESNIGLNAIAQWTFTLKNSLPQGLGTGSLFTNNIESPLEVREGKLLYNNDLEWNHKLIKDICT